MSKEGSQRSFSIAEDLDGFGICKAKPGERVREKLTDTLIRDENMGFSGYPGNGGLRRRDGGRRKERGGSKMRSQGHMKTLMMQQLK